MFLFSVKKESNVLVRSCLFQQAFAGTFSQIPHWNPKGKWNAGLGSCLSGDGQQGAHELSQGWADLSGAICVCCLMINKYYKWKDRGTSEPQLLIKERR